MSSILCFWDMMVTCNSLIKNPFGYNPIKPQKSHDGNVARCGEWCYSEHGCGIDHNCNSFNAGSITVFKYVYGIDHKLIPV